MVVSIVLLVRYQTKLNNHILMDLNLNSALTGTLAEFGKGLS